MKQKTEPERPLGEEISNLLQLTGLGREQARTGLSVGQVG